MNGLPRVLGDRPRILAHVRQDPELSGGLSIEDDRLPEDLLTFPAGWGASRVLEILGWLPAWRLVQAARPEFGSRVRLMGEGWLFGRLQAVVKGLGCFEAREREAAEAVIVWGGLTKQWARALRACRDKGTVVWSDADTHALDVNLYPDVHRRGLRVVAVPLATRPPGEDWAKTLKELAFLLDRGLSGGA